MMNDAKLNELLNEYKKTHSPEPSRALIDKIMRVPHEIEQTSGFSWKLSDWIVFLVPRLSGLKAALVMGIYMGGAGSSALAEDEIAEIDQGSMIVADAGSNLNDSEDALLNVEELIFIEE